jgi:hypothetical protein
MLALFITIFIASLIATPIVTGFLLKKFGNWSARKKKWAFTVICGFLCFPALMPAGITAAIPFPNIFALATMLYESPLDTAVLYYKAWPFNLPSLLITALIMRGIAAMVFYERKQDPA